MNIENALRKIVTLNLFSFKIKIEISFKKFLMQ